MATHVNIPTTGSGDPGPVPVATTDDAAGNKHQDVVAEYLAAGVPVAVTAATPLPVSVIASVAQITDGGGFQHQKTITEYLLAGVPQSVAAATPLPATLITPTSGGYSITRILSAASTNAGFSKASAGQVFGWYLQNTNTYTVFLKLYNKASAPTVGTDVPVMTIPVPGGGGANVEFMRGIVFATGIAYAITKLVADSDTTVVVANDLIVNLLWA